MLRRLTLESPFQWQRWLMTPRSKRAQWLLERSSKRRWIHDDRRRIIASAQALFAQQQQLYPGWQPPELHVEFGLERIG